MRTFERSATPSTMSFPASAEASPVPPHPVSAALVAALDHEFADPALLVDALTHRSWCAENEGVSNERLEFLGDAVLGLVIAERTYCDRPDLPEGQLAKIRASVVSAPALAATARGIGLGDALRLGRGELFGGGTDKESILADALEAVIGAVHLDAGLDAARALIGRLFGDLVDRSAILPGGHDYKTRLQELVARRVEPAPRYEVTDDGPDHDKRFHAVVVVVGRRHGPATGTSKKRAEQAAALLACTFLESAGGEDSEAVASRPLSGFVPVSASLTHPSSSAIF